MPSGSPANDIERRRRRRLTPRAVFFAAFALFAVFAIVLAPIWLPLTASSDDSLIAYERAQRYLRASLDLPLPGTPDVTQLATRLAEQGLAEGAPVFVRILKREFELELWMKRDGVFKRFATYPICQWSGKLGPKLKQGDRQAPEGFYSVDANALNPHSNWYRSFNLGYPNAYDAANGRTGSLIMVHGGCASVGCFAMTNAQIAEIWQLVTAAFKNGQKQFQVQVLPFSLSDEKLKGYAHDPNLPFWRSLKQGSDLFEATQLPPRVFVCNGSYGFEAAGVYPSGDGGIENRCPGAAAKS